MPSCVTAFHVTCAFDHSLEMRTILADNDEVKFKSFCQEHSDGGPRGEAPSEPVEPSPASEDLEKVTLRNPACRGTFGGRRKAVRDRLALQGGTGDFP